MSSDDTASSKSSVRKPSRKRILKLTNHILQICHRIHSCYSVPIQIKSIDELNSNIFIFFYETICNAELIGKLVYIIGKK